MTADHHAVCDPDSEDCASYDCPCLCHPDPPSTAAELVDLIIRALSDGKLELAVVLLESLVKVDPKRGEIIYRAMRLGIDSRRIER